MGSSKVSEIAVSCIFDIPILQNLNRNLNNGNLTYNEKMQSEILMRVSIMARYSVLAFNESEMPKSVHLDIFEFFISRIDANYF
jgi:hypothetical protein